MSNPRPHAERNPADRPLDHTHDAALAAWVEVAPASDFPLQNLPLGVFRRRGSADAGRIGAAIGADILDLSLCAEQGWLQGQVAAACRAPTLNALLGLGRVAWGSLRSQLHALLRATHPSHDPAAVRVALVPQRDADMLLPATVGDYTDFYASVYHATNVGRLFRPDNPLLPNYKYVPIGYHGRASSLVANASPVRRPQGQTKAPQDDAPTFGPSRSLDYELEMGAFVGSGNPLGQSIPLAEAEQHIFGLCLVNDWSARDIQSWEYQPLGPFLAKNFATTLGPWVVTLDALAPFRAAAFLRPEGDPAPLPYLWDADDQAHGGFDVTLEVLIASQRMRDADHAPFTLSRGNLQDLYWTLGQLLTHHASNGCNLQPGDLFASGTISGAEPGSRGCLLELTTRGAEPITLPTGEVRRFLADGDEVIFRAWCERPGFARIGWGECRGVVLPSAG